MKVLVFTAAFPNNVWPNHAVFVKSRMGRFAELADCEIRVVAPVPYHPPIRTGSRWKYSQVHRQETIDGIPVVHPRYLVVPKVGMVSHGLAMFLAGVGPLRRIRREFDFDVISAHTVYPDGLAGVLLGKYFERPVVVSARGTDINLFPKFPMIRRLIQYTLSRADRATAVCQALKDVMTSLGTPDDKVVVVPNGIDPTKFRYTDAGRARAALGLAPEGRMILSVGELIPRKGFHLLIQALPILAREHGMADLRLTIVGQGSFRAELEQMARSLGLEQRVSLVGSVPHADLPLWYCAADLFCMASDREGWTNALVEALACGTPAVATDVWGHPEIVRSDEMGLLTQRDERSLATTIAEALGRSWDRPSIARRGSARTWQEVAVEMRQVFQSVLAGSAG